MRWLDTALGLRVSTTKFTSSPCYTEHCLIRAVRPSDFSYKHKAERTINLVLTSLSDPLVEGVPDGLRAALGSSPTGTWSHSGYSYAGP